MPVENEIEQPGNDLVNTSDFVGESGAPTDPDLLQCTDPLLVYLGEEDPIDLWPLGQIHNELMDYLANYEYINEYATASFFLEFDTVFREYVNTENITLSPWFDTMFTYSELLYSYNFINLTDAAKLDSGYLYNSLLYNLGAITLDEKLFVDTIFYSIEIDTLLDYCTLFETWENLDKGEDFPGLYSAAALSLYLYSSYYWYEIGENPPSIISNSADFRRKPWLGGVLGDYAGLVIGYADYMYDNWANHNDPNFGIEALKNGGRTALSNSSLGLSEFLYH